MGMAITEAVTQVDTQVDTRTGTQATGTREFTAAVAPVAVTRVDAGVGVVAAGPGTDLDRAAASAGAGAPAGAAGVPARTAARVGAATRVRAAVVRVRAARTVGGATDGDTKDGGAKDAVKDETAEDCSGAYRPIPVWFFAFEGLFGASYDVVKTDPHGWIVIAVAAVVNLVLARTVLRGRLKMAKAILRGKKTRKIALGLIALRIGVHVALGRIGVEATTPAAHVAFALFMCATTVTLLAFEQRIILRALNEGSLHADS
jgi:hypothetical protein